MDGILPAAQALATLLRARRETIAVAESSSAGLLSAALLAQPGASRFFVGGVVVYTATARRALLGIADADMAGIRSASESYARLLARRVRERLGTTWGLSETGAAGPTGNSYGDAAGHCCVGLSGLGDDVVTVETGSSDRTANMRIFAGRAFELMLHHIGSLP